MEKTKEKAAFDLATVEQDDTASIQILHPTTGEEIGVVAVVYGQDSNVYREQARKAEIRYTDYSRRHRGKFMPPEEREALDKAKFAACTKSIGPLSYKGEAITDPAEIFNRFPWIYEQVSTAIHDRANFMKDLLKK